ncbi:peptidase S24/S26A/S26B/S26C [Gautieria morchelliformis]|nr:peptidase S24/S26A/S26B/S26C [Gautieria morchelliformis]
MPRSWAQLRAATRQHLSRATVAKTGRVAFTVTKWLCVFHLFAENVGGPRFVQGPSMLPTMHVSGDLVLEDTLSRRLSPPRINRGDLVTLLSPLEPTRTVCKRVIGLPGDTVCVHPDKAIQFRRPTSGKESDREGDGTPAQHEPEELQHVLVPEGHIWISGDNLANSRDSRVYGPIPIALVRGRIVARLYPSPQWFHDPVVYID